MVLSGLIVKLINKQELAGIIRDVIDTTGGQTGF